MPNKKNKNPRGLGNRSAPANTAKTQQVTTNAKGETKKKVRNVVSFSPGNIGNHYASALLNPFSDAALGVRVPDQFSAPTATVALREYASLISVTGKIEAYFMPNVYNPAASFGSNIANGQTMTTGDGVSFASGAISNTPSSLATKICNSRIVSWGLRIRNTTSALNASGIMTVALVTPHQRMSVPHRGAVGGQTPSGYAALSAENWFKSMGLPYQFAGSSARLDSSSLLDLPHHVRYQGPQLSEQTFEIHPKITDPSAFNFRNAQDGSFGFDMNPQTSTAFVLPGDASYLMLDGWTSVVVSFDTTATTAQTFDVEMIYHLEGTPNVSSGTNFITDSPISVCDPVGCLTAVAKLSNSQPFTKVGAAAMAALRTFAGS